MTKKFISWLSLMAVFILLLQSCRNDQFPEQETHNNGSAFRLTSKTISLSESKHFAKLSTELQKAEQTFKTFKANVSGKVVDYGNGVSIDTEQVIYIENGSNYHTYTFKINRENAPADAPVENLLLTPLPDGTYREFLVTYNFTEQEKQIILSGGDVDRKGKVEITELEKGTFGNPMGKQTCGYQDVDVYFACYTGDHHSGNESTWGSCNWESAEGGYPPLHYTMVAMVCTGDPDPIDDSFYPIGGGGSSGGGGIFPNPDPQPEEPPCVVVPSTSLDPTLIDENGCAIGTPTLPNLSSFPIVVKNLPTGLRDLLNNPANSEFYNGLQNYYNTNGGSNESITFITWAAQFKNDNPETTWEEFENWFMGTSEGKADENYDSAYWDDPNLVFPAQNLPTWQNYYNGFPKDSNGKGLSGPAVYNLIGGIPKALREEVLNDSNPSNDRDYDNACALRVSRALNYSGVIIPNLSGQTFKGGDGKYYFLSAQKLNKWMRKTFGTNPATSTTSYNPKHIHITGSQAGTNGINLPKLLKGVKGIYSLVSSNSSWASGHGDILQPNGTCINGCHFFDAPIAYIDVWILQ